MVSEHQIRPAEPGPGRIYAPGSQGPRSPRPTVPISWEALLAVLWPFVPCIGVLAPPAQMDRRHQARGETLVGEAPALGR